MPSPVNRAPPSPPKHAAITLKNGVDYERPFENKRQSPICTGHTRHMTKIKTHDLNPPRPSKVIWGGKYFLRCFAGWGELNLAPRRSCHFVSTPAASTASAKGKTRNRSQSLHVQAALRSRHLGRAPPVNEPSK